MTERDSFDCTPQQYHGGLDKLWAALNVEGVQDEDAFTLAAKRIAELEGEVERLRRGLAIIAAWAGTDESNPQGRIDAMADIEAKADELIGFPQADPQPAAEDETSPAP